MFCVSSASSFLVRFALRPLQAKEQLSAVSERDALPDCLSRAVLGLVAIDDDLGPGRNGILRETKSVQIIGAAAFNHPGDHLAVLTLNVNVDPRVRIGHFPLCDRPLQLERPGLVEFRRKPMMRPRPRGPRRKEQPDYQE